MVIYTVHANVAPVRARRLFIRKYAPAGGLVLGGGGGEGTVSFNGITIRLIWHVEHKIRNTYGKSYIDILYIHNNNHSI